MIPRSLIATLLLCGLAGCGGASTALHGAASVAPAPPATSATAPATTTTAPGAVAAVRPRRPRHRRRPSGPPPGALPQTNQLPSGATAAFRAEMAALWRGVVTGAVSPALPAFFPERAYLQVKAIADPASDWRFRLVVDYGLDLAAAHRLLGRDPGSARLLRVQVPAGFAHWVPPHVCYNRIGYYEVPGARVVYSQGGAERSFGIASMISWRGVWYVVHLGAVVRAGASGLVDAPAVGPGISQPSMTC